MQQGTLPTSIAAQSPPKENIYENYILPYINNADKGDEILLVTPSTLFGFYQQGVRCFEIVCEALKNAHTRGAEVKIIIDVHDLFTAKAAEGLLTFLAPGRELRQLEGTTDTYYIVVYNKQDNSRHVEFMSETPKTLEYLPGIQIRPYGRVKGQPMENMPNQEADAVRRAFDEDWQRASGRVKDAIEKYTPVERLRQRLKFFQGFTYFAVLAVGLILGLTFSLQSQPQLDVGTVLVWLAATLGLGVIGNLLSEFFTKHSS